MNPLWWVYAAAVILGIPLGGYLLARISPRGWL